MLTNPKYERFAHEIAAGRQLADAYVVAGGSRKGARQSAARLLRMPQVVRRVEQLRAEINRAVIARTVADKQARVDSLVRDYELLEQLRIERSLDPEIQRGPGGKTGLIVRKLKVIGSGDMAQEVEEFSFDRDHFAESRAIREQVARELGQITDKHESRIIRSLEDLSTEELEAIVDERKADARA